MTQDSWTLISADDKPIQTMTVRVTIEDAFGCHGRCYVSRDPNGDWHCYGKVSVVGENVSGYELMAWLYHSEDVVSAEVVDGVTVGVIRTA